MSTSDTTRAGIHQRSSYRWHRRRFWLAILIYWFLGTLGAGALARWGAQRHEEAWVISLMLLFVIVCTSTERGRWKVWQRVAFVPAAWLGHALLSVPAVLAVGIPLAAGPRPDFADRMVTLVASIPVIVFAMRQSRLFVRRVSETDAPVQGARNFRFQPSAARFARCGG